MSARAWRQETFDALGRAARNETWPDYARFAALQVDGLRDAALAECGAFAASLATQPREQRWRFAEWLCTEILTPKVVTEPLVPFPLRTQVVVPTLVETYRTVPSEPRSAVWLVGRFTAEVYSESPATGDPVEALLSEQLARTPDAASVARCLANHLLGRLESDAHHLHDSAYLGDPADGLSLVSRIEQLVPDSADPLRIDAERQRELLVAWRQFGGSGATDFPEWCIANGFEPPTGATYWYQG